MDVTLLGFLTEVLGFLAEIVVFFLSLVWIPIVVLPIWLLIKLWVKMWERFGPEDKTIHAFGEDNLREKIQNIALKHKNEKWMEFDFFRGGDWNLDPEKVSRRLSVRQALYPNTPLWKIIKEVKSSEKVHHYPVPTALWVSILNEEGEKVEYYRLEYHNG